MCSSAPNSSLNAPPAAVLGAAGCTLHILASVQPVQHAASEHFARHFHPYSKHSRTWQRTQAGAMPTARCCTQTSHETPQHPATDLFVSPEPHPLFSSHPCASTRLTTLGLRSLSCNATPLHPPLHPPLRASRMYFRRHRHHHATTNTYTHAAQPQYHI